MVTNKKTKANHQFIKDNDISKLIKFLYRDTNSITSSIQSKEASSWAALLFYFVILYYFNNFIFDKICTPNFDNIISSIIILLVPFILWYIFFRFIHAHYQQSFYTNTYNFVIRTTIIELISKKALFLFENDIKNKDELHNYIQKETKVKFKSNSEMGNMHPLQMVLAFWFGKWILPNKGISKENNKVKKILNNRKRQAAAIYSLIFFSTLLYEIYLLKILGIFELLNKLFMKAINCLF